MIEVSTFCCLILNIDLNFKNDQLEIVYFENEYAFVKGTIQDGDLIVLGGAAKIIPGKKIN